MLTTETTTIRAKFIGLTDGETPSVRLHKLLQRPDGSQKPFSMSVPVRDAELLRRIRQELNRGDEIEAKIETRWDEAGIPKTLLDFSKVFASHGQALAVAGAA